MDEDRIDDADQTPVEDLGADAGVEGVDAPPQDDYATTPLPMTVDEPTTAEPESARVFDEGSSALLEEPAPGEPDLDASGPEQPVPPPEAFAPAWAPAEPTQPTDGEAEAPAEASLEVAAVEEPGEKTEAAPEETEAAPEETEAVLEEPEGGQQTLEIGPVAPAEPVPEAAAAVVAAAEETHVATYGEPDLDEMVASLKQTAPAVASDGTPIAPPGAAGAHLAVEARPLTPTWPFIAYAGAWLVFAGAFAWFLRGPAGKGDILGSYLYPIFLYAGLAMAGLGVVLVIGVWLWARSKRPKGDRAGLFTSAFFKGALVLFLGMVLWWGASYAAMYLADM